MDEYSAARVAFLDVGQGDTTVVWNPSCGEAIVVDCVDPLPVWDLLNKEKVRRIPAVVVTHLHADHYAGLVSFLDGCQPRGIEWDAVYFYWFQEVARWPRLLEDGDRHSESTEDSRSIRRQKRRSMYQTLAHWADVKPNHERYRDPSHLKEDSVQGIRTELLHPVPAQIPRLMGSGELNNLSVVLRVSNDDASVLLTGDLEPAGWDVLVENVPDLSSEVMKFPHHGAWRRNDVDEVLARVRPHIAIISVGTIGKRYDHPSANVLDALRRQSLIYTACTQATRKCVADPDKAKECVRGVLAAVPNGTDVWCSSSGCPCASTVVVQLGNPPKVLHPSPQMHIQIIEECLSGARCFDATRHQSATGC